MSPIRENKRDLRRASDLSRADLEVVFELSTQFKDALRRGERTDALAGRSLAMIFEKPSLRTRTTFELGMVQLGGHAIYLSKDEVGVGKRESVRDIGRNLERWFDLALARTFHQATVEELADNCRIPFINALSDEEHPCQAVTDYFTLRERFGALDGMRLAYVGDGNNICHSLLILGARLGLNLSVASPEGYEPDPRVVESLAPHLAATGGSYEFHRAPQDAVAKADAIYTDVWTSMGQEEETAIRLRAFAGYQVNDELLRHAPDGAVVMHDLPAHRGEEISDDVLDSARCIAFDQAENRLHAQKGILAFLHEASA